MFRDLHEGILSEFAERQEMARIDIESRIHTPLELKRRRRIASCRAWVKQDAVIARKLRRARPTWQPVKPAVTLSACATCGAIVERRQGCRAPIAHRCRRSEAA